MDAATGGGFLDIMKLNLLDIDTILSGKILGIQVEVNSRSDRQQGTVSLNSCSNTVPVV